MKYTASEAKENANMGICFVTTSLISCKKEQQVLDQIYDEIKCASNEHKFFLRKHLDEAELKIRREGIKRIALELMNDGYSVVCEFIDRDHSVTGIVILDISWAK